MPSAPESLGWGRNGNKGVPVPLAPEPCATGHAFEYGLATLGLGREPLAHRDTAPTRNASNTVVAYSTSGTAPVHLLVVCQSPIGKSIGEPQVPNTNIQWTWVVDRGQPAGASVAEDPAGGIAVRPSEGRQWLLETWWLNQKSSHWWMVLCYLLLANHQWREHDSS